MTGLRDGSSPWMMSGSLSLRAQIMNIKLNRLPHFWIIVIILDLFIVIYNANFIDIWAGSPGAPM